MSVLREADAARVQHQQNSGVLRDYSLCHRVAIKWYPAEASRSKELPFWLTIDGETVVMDWREWTRLQRAEFFTRYGDQAPYRFTNMDGDRVRISLAHLNSEAERDSIFRLWLDETEVILDYEELLRLTRWI